VVFTDLVDSTKMQIGMGDEAWRRLIDRHDEICTHNVARYRGRLVKFTGDGMLATCNASTNAVACALTTADSLSGLGFSCRCGIHTGDIELRGDDVSGLGANVVARMMYRAEGGQVLTSDLTRQLMFGASHRFDALGEYPLKGVPDIRGSFRPSLLEPPC